MYRLLVAAKKQPQPEQPLGFEAAMAQLEAIIERIESGGAGLEESLREYERGVHLLGHCQKVLAVAEQRLDELKADRPPAQPAPGTRDDSDEGEDDSTPRTARDDLPF
ncbi:MAG: exodeoxyribonuclease VII small subunit [Phycisphaerales bacterium]